MMKVAQRLHNAEFIASLRMYGAINVHMCGHFELAALQKARQLQPEFKLDGHCRNELLAQETDYCYLKSR